VRGFLIVLDAGEHAVRCRACLWRSGGHPTLRRAIEAFDGHRCPAIRPPVRGPGAANDGSGDPDGRDPIANPRRLA
jgi:hypothetical protein